MTEDQAAESTHHHHAAPPADVYLYSLMAVLDADDTKESAVSVTVMVGGGAVCGELISHARWRAEMDAILKGLGGEGPQLVTRMMQIIDQETGPRDEGQPLSYLHLKDAQVVTNYRGTINGIEQMGPKTPLWRTRLSDIQGWTIGRPA